MVLHGVDDDEHVSEFGGDDPSTVVSGMLRPNNVDLVIAQVSKLDVEEESCVCMCVVWGGGATRKRK